MEKHIYCKRNTPQDEFLIISHGLRGHDENKIGDGQWKNTYTAKEMGSLIKENPLFKAAKKVRLASCWAGDNGFASELAKELDMPVIAPDKVLRISDPEGDMDDVQIGSPNLDGTVKEDGGWFEYSPDGSKNEY